MESRDVLVFGGSGWAGRAFVARLAAAGRTHWAPSHAEVDLGDAPAVAAAIERTRSRVVVNLAAAQPSASPQELDAVNRVGAARVAEAAADHGARLVHVSSDVVFDGRSAPYTEDDVRSPLTPYGRSKAGGEALVLGLHENAVAVRTSLLWDPDQINRGTALFAERLAAGEPCPLFTDEIRCPLPRAVLAEALLRLIDAPVCGPLHVAGTEALSRHAFGTLLLERFDVPGRERVIPARAADLEAAGAAPRPRDLTLDVARATAELGLTLPGVRDVLGR